MDVMRIAAAIRAHRWNPSLSHRCARMRTKDSKELIELREVGVREIEADKLRPRFGALCSVGFHGLGKGIILGLRRVAEEEFCSPACLTIVGM